MDTRSRAVKTSWLRWRLGSVLGSIAKRLVGPSVPISAVILARTASATVSPEQPLEDVVQMFVTNRATEVPVIDHGVAIGVATRNAVDDTLEHEGPHTPVGLVALSDVVVVKPDATLDDVREQLEDHPGAVALVVDHGAAVGMVTREELDAFLEERSAA
jgi:CBS domain-containing protein